MWNETRPGSRLSVIGFLLLANWSTVGSAQPALDEQDLLTREERLALPLAEKLRISRPAPSTPPPSFVPAPGAPDVMQSKTVGGQVRELDGRPPLADDARQSDQSIPPDLDVAAPENKGGTTRSPTPPAILRNTHSFPFSTISKMLMEFDGYIYNCSATLINRYFLLTAAHCIYNHDPNQDGDTSDAQWADNVWVFPGQTDYISVDGYVERPFGEANWRELYAYTGWTQQGNIEFDQAFVRIDRPLGDRTGWMGYETNTSTSALNFSGYPTETPYVPSGSLVQYKGYDPDNVTGYNTNRIFMEALTYGGHSGGPAWRYDGDQRRLQGMNSTSNRAGSAAAARITNQVFDDLQAEIDEPRTVVLRSDLAEWTRWTAYPTKALYTPFAQPGESISFDYNIGNHGFADTGTIYVDFYLSRIPFFRYPPTSADEYLGQAQLSNLQSGQWFLPFATLPLPADIDGGTWYVSWFAFGSTGEYASTTSTWCSPFCNNTATIETQPLQVAHAWERPDLITTSLNAPAYDLRQNEPILIDVLVENVGNFSAPSFWNGLYLSADSDCSAVADLALAVYPNSALGGGASWPTSVSISIPETAPVGAAWLCAIADVFDDANESDEVNNSAAIGINVLRPDLIFHGSFGG